MGTMTDWARHEVELACKKENPNWDGQSFDYGCSCYGSALKAYESLMNDGHSGFSYSVTKNILKKLLDGLPLTPITDDDFPGKEIDNSKDERTYEYAMGIKSSIQCPRKSSLFRDEDLEGNVKYHDNSRAYCQDVEFPDDTFSSSMCNIVDEIDPIIMPYMGTNGSWIVHTSTFLCDKSHGDYDHHAVEYVEDPNGKIYDIQRYWREDESGKMVECTKEEYEYDKAVLRIDTISNKVIERLYSSIIDYIYDHNGTRIATEEGDELWNGLMERCGFFEHCKPEYREWHVLRKIASCEFECDDQIFMLNISRLMEFIKPYTK